MWNLRNTFRSLGVEGEPLTALDAGRLVLLVSHKAVGEVSSVVKLANMLFMG